ncbi:MAG: hypothetical protein E7488_05925 [Ruminococcaceae bacterium]|nr:hypothetical protein [Oscillospiraceae bacterium]
MKLYKATTSFAGKVCMAVNEERRLANKDAAGLLECGYIIPVEEPAPQQTENSSDETDSAETVTETPENVTETEETVSETAENVVETEGTVSEQAEDKKGKKK